MAEDADGDLRVHEGCLNGAREGDEGTLAVLARPDIAVTVGRRFDLAAPLVGPGVPLIVAPEELDEEVVAIMQTKPAHARGVFAALVDPIPCTEQFIERCASKLQGELAIGCGWSPRRRHLCCAR